MTTIRIASRASKMATAQVERITAALATYGISAEFVPVSTSGDRWAGDLAELGGKGAFTSEVEAHLLDGRADMALHCLKDMPGDVEPTPGLMCFYPARDDGSDVLVSPAGLKLDDMPAGARVGTSAARRVAQLRASHPHLELVPVRGNADTRIAKAHAGEVDAVILAKCGLARIGQAHAITETLSWERLMPAIGAGQLAMQVRTDDARTVAAVALLADVEATIEAEAERALVRALQGHCHAPIAGFALGYGPGSPKAGTVELEARVWSADGTRMLHAKHEGRGAETVGLVVAQSLIDQGAYELLEGSRR